MFILDFGKRFKIRATQEEREDLFLTIVGHTLGTFVCNLFFRHMHLVCFSLCFSRFFLEHRMGRFFHLKPDMCIATGYVLLALTPLVVYLLCVRLLFLYDSFNRSLLVLVNSHKTNQKK